MKTRFFSLFITHVSFFFPLEMGSHLAQADLNHAMSEDDLELSILLQLLPECWNYRCMLSHQVYMILYELNPELQSYKAGTL